MMREGYRALPFVLETNVVILEHQPEGLRRRALALFAAAAQRAIGLPGEVNILITNSRRVQGLNRRYRGKDKPTDVLSFPAASPPLAGDISISAEIAAQNAAELGHSLETEVRILMLHGLLHLAGHDHEADDGEMQNLEIALRRRFDLPPGLIERTHAYLENGATGPKRKAKADSGGQVASHGKASSRQRRGGRLR